MKYFKALRNRGRSINERIARKWRMFLQSHDYTDLDACRPIKKYSFIFVCQQGVNEIGALLLAASLRRYLKCDYELVAAVPTPSDIMGKPNPMSIKLLEEMGVRIVNIYNEIVGKNRLDKRHFITNKMYCLNIPTGADKVIFIDSDFLCRNDFGGDPRFLIPFNARLAIGSGARGYEGRWFKFYETANARMPLIRIRVEDGEHVRYVPPSFNSGFIAVNADRAAELAECWFECWETFDREGIVSSRPYHIGQYSLSVAVAKMNMPFEIIERSWLFKHFLCWHKVPEMGKSDATMSLVMSLLEEYPGIIEIIKEVPEFNFLLERKKETKTKVRSFKTINSIVHLLSWMTSMAGLLPTLMEAI